MSSPTLLTCRELIMMCICVCFQKKVEKRVFHETVNICKSSDEYINIFDGRDSQNNIFRTCVSKKSRKKSVHEIVNICKSSDEYKYIHGSSKQSFENTCSSKKVEKRVHETSEYLCMIH